MAHPTPTLLCREAPDDFNAAKLISGFESPVDSTGVRKPDLCVDVRGEDNVRGGGPPRAIFASVHSAALHGGRKAHVAPRFLMLCRPCPGLPPQRTQKRRASGPWAWFVSQLLSQCLRTGLRCSALRASPQSKHSPPPHFFVSAHSRVLSGAKL